MRVTINFLEVFTGTLLCGDVCAYEACVDSTVFGADLACVMRDRRTKT